MPWSRATLGAPRQTAAATEPALQARSQVLELRENCPMGQMIIGGLLAMGGALASQVTGVLSLASSGRRRGHDAVARRAAEREAKRRQLYEELLRTVNDAQLHCAEMSEACRRLDPQDPALSGLADGLPERLDAVRTVAVAVMIDGSARASEIAATITGAARELTQACKAAGKTPDAEGPGLVASRLPELATLLGRSEKELIAAARADFGVPD
jgi:hypothetical protein